MHRSYSDSENMVLEILGHRLLYQVLADQGLPGSTWGLPAPVFLQGLGMWWGVGVWEGKSEHTHRHAHVCSPTHRRVWVLLKWGFVRQWGLQGWEGEHPSRSAELRQGRPQKNRLRPSPGGWAPDMSGVYMWAQQLDPQGQGPLQPAHCTPGWPRLC